MFQGALSSASHCTCSYARTWKPGVASPSSSSLGGRPPVQAPVGAQPMSTLPHPTLAQPTLTTPAFVALAGSAANGHRDLCSVAHKSCFSPSLLEKRQWGEPVSMYAMHESATADLKGQTQRKLRAWGIQWNQNLRKQPLLNYVHVPCVCARACVAGVGGRCPGRILTCSISYNTHSSSMCCNSTFHGRKLRRGEFKSHVLGHTVLTW